MIFTKYLRKKIIQVASGKVPAQAIDPVVLICNPVVPVVYLGVLNLVYTYRQHNRFLYRLKMGSMHSYGAVYT